MTLQLSAGQSALDRLETAIARLVQKHGFSRVDRDGAGFPAPLTVLLLTEDPQRNPEVLDACVILPEALKPFGDGIARRVAGPDSAPALIRAYGVARPPAVVVLRAGRYVGTLNGIRDWADYQAELAALLDASARPARRPLAIPVVGGSASGGCA